MPLEAQSKTLCFIFLEGPYNKVSIVLITLLKIFNLYNQSVF